MTEFGQAGVPQVFQDATQQSLTQAGFLSQLTRAMETVGMVPLRGLWPWDTTASPEFPVAEDNNEPYLFPFDYPDTDTFSVNNELWRPCVVVAAYFTQFNFSSSNNNAGKIYVLDAIRRDGEVTLDTIFITNRHRGVEVNFGWTNATSDHETTQDHEGAFAQLNTWLPFSGSSATVKVDTLNVGNLYAYLGRAGLFLYAGSGTTRQQFGDILSVGFIFGGGRIPGREITPDPNLNRISPIIPLYMKSTGNSSTGSPQWRTDEEEYEVIVHGIQFDQKSSLAPVRSRVFNLENLEIPVYPFYSPFSAPSPRAVAGGGGAHILGRLVHVVTSLETNDGDLFGPVESAIDTGQVRPSFGEVFTAPGFRWCDRAAPIGLNEDPNTLDDWYLAPLPNVDMLIALYYENANVVSELANLTLTQTDDDYFNMTGTPGLSFPNIAGGVPVPSVTLDNEGSIAWDDTDAGDLVTCLNDGAQNAQTAEMEWIVVTPSGDPVDTLYRIEFEARNRDDASTEGDAPLRFEVFVNGTWTQVLELNSAGDNTGLAAYNFQSFEFDCPVDSTVTAQRQLKFRWVGVRPSSSIEGNTITVQNVNLLKYRYI